MAAHQVSPSRRWSITSISEAARRLDRGQRGWRGGDAIPRVGEQLREQAKHPGIVIHDEEMARHDIGHVGSRGSGSGPAAGATVALQSQRTYVLVTPALAIAPAALINRSQTGRMARRWGGPARS